MNNPHNQADKTYVVVENGQRVTKPMETQASANTEAQRRNKLAESGGKPVPENKRAQVKMNLCG